MSQGLPFPIFSPLAWVEVTSRGRNWAQFSFSQQVPNCFNLLSAKWGAWGAERLPTSVLGQLPRITHTHTNVERYSDDAYPLKIIQAQMTWCFFPVAVRLEIPATYSNNSRHWLTLFSRVNIICMRIEIFITTEDTE